MLAAVDEVVEGSCRGEEVFEVATINEFGAGLANAKRLGSRTVSHRPRDQKNQCHCTPFHQYLPCT